MHIQFLSGPYEGRTFPVDISQPIVFGRHGNAPLPDTRASRQHARLSLLLGKWTLQDLNSRNGTFLNDKRLRAPETINEGDTIEIGRSTFVIRDIATQTHDGARLKAPDRSLEASTRDHAVPMTIASAATTPVVSANIRIAPNKGVDESVEPESANLIELPDSTPWDDALEWSGLAAAESPTAEGIDAVMSSDGAAVDLQDVETQHPEPSINAIPEEPPAATTEFIAAPPSADEAEAADAEQSGESDADVSQQQIESPPSTQAEVELPEGKLDVTEWEMDAPSFDLPQVALKDDDPALESSASDIPEVLPDVDTPKAVLFPLDAPEALEVDAAVGAAAVLDPPELNHDDASAPLQASMDDSLKEEDAVEATDTVLTGEIEPLIIDGSRPSETFDGALETVAVEATIEQPTISEWDIQEGEVAGSTGSFDGVAISTPGATFADDESVIQATNSSSNATRVEASPSGMSATTTSLGDEGVEPVEEEDANPSRAEASAAMVRSITPLLTDLKRNTPAQGVALAARDADPLAPCPWPSEPTAAPARRLWPYVLLFAILIAVLANGMMQFVSQRQMRNEVATLRSVLAENEQETAELLIDEIRRELRERPLESNAQSPADWSAALARQTAASELAARELAEQLERGQASESAFEQQRSSQAASDVSRVLAELDVLKQSINKLGDSTALATAQTATGAAPTTASPPAKTEAGGSNIVKTEAQPAPIANQRVPEAPSRDEANTAVQANSQVSPAAAVSPTVVYFIDASNALKNSVPEAMAEVRRLMKQTRGRDASAVFMLYGNRLVHVNDPTATDPPAVEPNGEDIVDLGKMDLKQAIERANEARPRTLHILSDKLGNSTAMRDALNGPAFAGIRVHVMQFYSRQSQDVLKSIARDHNGYYTHVSPAE